MPQAAVPADHVARVEFDVFCAALFYARFYEVAGQFTVNAVFVHDMLYYLSFVTARHKLHTPIFARCRVECHPRIKRFGFSVAPEAVVLMPGCCAARFCGFYKYAVEFDDDVVAQKMSRYGEHLFPCVKCVPDEGGFDAEIAEFSKSQGARFRGVAHGVHGICIGVATWLGFEQFIFYDAAHVKSSVFWYDVALDKESLFFPLVFLFFSGFPIIHGIDLLYVEWKDNTNNPTFPRLSSF